MISIFVGTLIFSIWGIIIFFGKCIGLSMLLFAVPFTLFLIHILEKNKKVVNKKAKLLIIPITLLSSTYFIFNNSFFDIINILIIPSLVALMILWLFNEEFKCSLISKIVQVIFKPLGSVEETFTKLSASLREKVKVNINAQNKSKIKKVVKSILITLPIALVIIGLLSSADENFRAIFTGLTKNILNAILSIKISAIIARIILIFCTFVYLICFFYYITSIYKKQNEEVYTERKPKDNFTIRVILGVLNVIYLVFCIIQIKSLFVINEDIELSRYARQGFFQLMAVSLINLITILIAKNAENKQEKNANKYINTMCIIMVIFTFVILISATLRMYLYENAFGYTFLRLFVYCSLFTEAILLIPTILYILDKKANLAKTYFIIIISVYTCMNFADFNYVIAKRNIDRYEKTGKIDVDYLIDNTGVDAVSQIIKIANQEGEMTEDKSKAGKHLQRIYENLNSQNMDFRDFNISKIYAKKLIEENEIQSKDYEYKAKKQKNDERIKDKKYNRIENLEEVQDVLYEKEMPGTSIRVIYGGSALGQKMGIKVQKTIDGGKTWKNQLKTSDGYMTVNNGANFLFINEKVRLYKQQKSNYTRSGK